ncbi:glycoside hydrolase family 127 protein [Kibdelosporangium persicum]|uniref:Transcriptional initiation protein Tat n=1 Tax=Kibdelosporangium persicum TaxID=2698649 RepID=A0ABX2EW38_9PSEU|nr:RICIN domain-containing protein [Kibdelosporangium persicum]NRN63250.1 Transcriptional initiation protein Tat [Kibdelosporangium persicum]
MKSFRRRTLLRTTAAAAATTLLPDHTAHAAPAPAAYERLRPGAVEPHGWLATQLDRQLTGLNGRFPEISPFLRFDQTGWVHPDLNGWEEVPYWLRGYGDLGYVTGDDRVLADTERWINAVLATQAQDGYFGPRAQRTSLNGHADLWPHMPMLHALRSWAEYRDDARVESALTRYFDFMTRQPDAVFKDGWGTTRWGDTIDVLVWLHGRTGDQALLDLTHRIHRHAASWVDTIASLHNVNFAQGFREPAQYWQLSKNPVHRDSVYRVYNAIMAQYGQFPGGGFAGDENARPGYGDPRQGFETCGVVEFMASHELLTRITGDPLWADRTEELAFNMLPACLDPQGKVTHYVTSANGVQLDDFAKTRRQFQNGFAMQAYKPGIHAYRCCPHNYGQGWPYYVEEMWLTTSDGGIVASLYGPSTVTVGTTKIEQQTNYPFSDTITFRLTLPQPKRFPFSVRVPSWCANPLLTVNGTAVIAPAGPKYATITRTWQTGDIVRLRLPMSPRTRIWQNKAVSVDYGALTFSLRIEERWNRYAGTADWPEYEVKPASAWNYGLRPNQQFTVSTGGDLNDPFTLANAPIQLTARAQAIPDWTVDSENVVGTMNSGPVATDAPVQQVTLVPMAAARLRITAFPQTGGSKGWGTPGVLCRIQNKHSVRELAVEGTSRVVQFSPGHLWRIVDVGNGQVKVRNEQSGKVLGVDGMSTANSAQVVQYADNGTADHRWQVVDNGDGWFRLKNVHSGKVLGVQDMSTANSARVVQYDDNGTADHLWRIMPEGIVRIQNLNSTKVLGVDQMSTADSARVVQFADNGTADHDWRFLPDANGYFRIRNEHSGKVLGIQDMSTANSAHAVQFADNGTADHLWRFRADSDNLWRLQNAHSGKVLGVDLMSYDDSAQVVQFDDNGTADHLWRLL